MGLLKNFLPSFLCYMSASYGNMSVVKWTWVTNSVNIKYLIFVIEITTSATSVYKTCFSIIKR
jgi:hypothetical protein